jgi:cytochrome c oxidase subunit 2
MSVAPGGPSASGWRRLARRARRPASCASVISIVLLPAAAAGADAPALTPSIFAPVSTPAFAIRELAFFVLGITAVIFLVVAGLAAYALVRFRRRRDDDGREPPQVYGSRQIELAWTLAPLLIVVVLFLVTARYIYGIERRAQPPDALEVRIVGHQWWWEIRYPRLGIVTANELHLPVSDPARPAPTYITLESADVIHSFWVPRLAGKMDVIPNKINRLWIEPRTTGTYVGQCAEYCGLQHAGMRLLVTVHAADDFARWAADQQAPARDDARARDGRGLFTSLACINCHTVRGTEANGVFGPDLTHLMSRATIGAGVIQNTPETLRAWVDDPASLKPGALMPAMKLSREDLDKVTAYLVTLR